MVKKYKEEHFLINFMDRPYMSSDFFERSCDTVSEISVKVIGESVKLKVLSALRIETGGSAGVILLKMFKGALTKNLLSSLAISAGFV